MSKMSKASAKWATELHVLTGHQNCTWKIVSELTIFKLCHSSGLGMETKLTWRETFEKSGSTYSTMVNSPEYLASTYNAVPSFHDFFHTYFISVANVTMVSYTRSTTSSHRLLGGLYTRVTDSPREATVTYLIAILFRWMRVRYQCLRCYEEHTCLILLGVQLHPVGMTWERWSQ